MNASERRLELLKTLNSKSTTINDLAEEFEVSLMTIRRDLKEFEEQGVVYISNGTVHLNKSVGFEETFVLKSGKYTLEKARIGSEASSMIQEGDVVYIDCGTTGQDVAEALVKKNIQVTVFTSSILAVNILIQSKNVELYMLPGKFRSKSVGFIGHLTMNFVSNLKFDVAFMGCEGIDLKYGVSTPNLEEGSTKRAVVEASNRVVVITDSSKFGVTTLSAYASLKEIYCIITNVDEQVNFEQFHESGLNIKFV